MAGEENLKPFPPGVSGNPEGKKKGTRNRSTIVREALEAVAEDGVMFVDKATIAILAKALTGDVQAFKELMDSGYGKTVESLEIKSDNNHTGAVDVKGLPNLMDAIASEIQRTRAKNSLSTSGADEPVLPSAVSA